MKITYLLPANRTLLEEAFLVAFEKSLTLMPSRSPDLLNADNASFETLQYLANDRGVTNWRKSDDEAVKRSMIKNQWPLNALNGTEVAIDYALSIFSLKGSMTFPAPYCIDLVCYKDNNAPLGGNFDAQRLMTSLNQATNCRDTLSLKMSFGIEKVFTLCGAIGNAINVNAITAKATLPPPESYRVNVSVACVIAPQINYNDINATAY
ncbi:MAG: hypothetical protein HRU38_26280 [Saccharospirillaceae bacterium]|nr:hypothetical protein [Saccharospirillaceae bacterium]